MPTYRSINIALHSQFDIETLPEYHPSASPFASTLDASVAAPSINDATSTCSVYIPALLGSQFWIAYSVSPPVPAGHYFLFKLYIDGENIVSWSTGKEHSWTGKTMFGLFDAGDDKTIEKRALCFSAPDRNGRVNDGFVEIRVHRASGRKRVEREVKMYETMSHAKREGGISLVNAGRAGIEQPKRFYKFALIDPVDQPFATFRYHYRTWDQLRELGLLDSGYYAESEGNDLSIIEPEEGSPRSSASKHDDTTMNVFHNKPAEIFEARNLRDSIQGVAVQADEQKFEDPNKRQSTLSENDICTRLRNRCSISSSTYIPCGTPYEVSSGSPRSLRRRGRLDTYRLSMPPAIKFDAPQPSSRPLPLPQKNSLTTSTAYRPHPAYPVEEWTMRTPSPVRSGRDGIATPPLEGRRGLGIAGAGLVGGLLFTWRRSVSSTQETKNMEPDQGVRSVS